MKKNIVILYILMASFHMVWGISSNPIPQIKDKLFDLSMERMYRNEDFTNTQRKKIIKLLDSNGSWKDINYQGDSRSSWEPSEHWRRLFELSFLYQSKKGPYYHDEKLKGKIISAIRYWMNNKPLSQNVWWNGIGIPLAIGKVYILMEKEIPKDLMDQGIELINRNIKSDYYHFGGVATAQNLLWLTYAHIYSSCLSNDQIGLKRAFTSASKEITISEKEGIQPDYSFHQHGPQFYSFGYGATFTLTSTHLIYLAQDTPFQFSKDKIETISHYILDGQQWATRNQVLEYAAMGRVVSRNISNLNSILNAITLMSRIDVNRQSEYQEFYNQLKTGERKTPLIGNRYYNYSDFMVHQRPEYYFSLKGASKEIIASESGNGENLKGHYLGHGTYYLIKDGNEYKSIFPLLNWKQLPGSLVEQDTLKLPLIEWGKNNYGNTEFVFGVSDSLYGAFGYDYVKGNVRAKRGWFLFNEEIIALVSGLNYDSDNDLYQSINQCYVNGSIWVNNQKMKGAIFNDSKVKKVFHNSVGYIIKSEPFTTEVTAKMETGSWSEINVGKSSEPISKKIFSLNLNLGKHLENQSFMYAILPNMTLNTFKTFKLEDTIELLKNNAEIQAVYHKKLNQVQAIFYEAGDLLLPWGQHLKLNKPGLVMVKIVDNQLVINMNPQLDSTTYKTEINKDFKSNKNILELSISDVIKSDKF
ncbi:polysaccharide lyase family 8 super-sandwich domain-containing protein [Gaetbulibacter sp. M240]|uniref:polysaccharide lyase family 8 super-sandwich domain-containing protein n=1 Tax=Gaetbulibacter sp. M240 TaxID=3126511 RepID=UPI00374FCA22